MVSVGTSSPSRSGTSERCVPEVDDRRVEPDRMEQLAKCEGIGTRSLFMAYLLWLFCPVPGVHHVYLGRDNHAALHALTLGGLGLLWLGDFFLLPQYVHLANTVLKENVEPPRFGTMRMVAMVLIGSLCGWYSARIFASEFGSEPSRWTHSVVTRLIQCITAATAVYMSGAIPPFDASLRKMIVASIPCALILAFSTPNPQKYILAPSLMAVICFRSTIFLVCPSRASRAPMTKRLLRLVAILIVSWSMWGCAFWRYGVMPVVDIDREQNMHSGSREAAWSLLLLATDYRRGSAFASRIMSDLPRQGVWRTWSSAIKDLFSENRAWNVLQIAPGSTMREVKRAYRQLAKEYHPDKASVLSLGVAERNFRLIHEAFELLRRLHGTKCASEDDTPGARTDGREMTQDHDKDDL